MFSGDRINHLPINAATAHARMLSYRPTLLHSCLDNRSQGHPSDPNYWDRQVQ